MQLRTIPQARKAHSHKHTYTITYASKIRSNNIPSNKYK